MIAPAHRLSLLLLAGTALLAVVAAQPFAAHHAVGVHSPPSIASASIDLPAGPGPVEAYRETSARPLFTPERRPPAPQAVVAPAAPKVTLRLDGLVVTRERKEAIVTESGEGKRVRVREGDTVAGWKVRSIERDRITLVSPEGEMTLSPGR